MQISGSRRTRGSPANSIIPVIHVRSSRQFSAPIRHGQRGGRHFIDLVGVVRLGRSFHEQTANAPIHGPFRTAANSRTRQSDERMLGRYSHRWLLPIAAALPGAVGFFREVS